MSEGAATLFALAALAVVAAEEPAPNELHYAGSPNAARVLEALVSHYDGAPLTLEAVPDATTACLWQESCNLALVSGPASDRLAARGAVVTWLAKEPVAVVAHPSNAVGSLTRAQLDAVLRGEVTRWAELGGADRPIKLRGRAKGEPGHRCELALAAEVQREPDGLAVVGVDVLTAQPDLHVLAIDAKKPLDDPGYPLLRDIFLVTKGEPAPRLRAFVDWVRAVEGDVIDAPLGVQSPVGNGQ
ncbi:MAG: substrate-binding domain-containing protein [Pseudomonadota bacterium]